MWLYCNWWYIYHDLFWIGSKGPCHQLPPDRLLVPQLLHATVEMLPSYCSSDICLDQFLMVKRMTQQNSLTRLTFKRHLPPIPFSFNLFQSSCALLHPMPSTVLSSIIPVAIVTIVVTTSSTCQGFSKTCPCPWFMTVHNGPWWSKVLFKPTGKKNRNRLRTLQYTTTHFFMPLFVSMILRASDMTAFRQWLLGNFQHWKLMRWECPHIGARIAHSPILPILCVLGTWGDIGCKRLQENNDNCSFRVVASAVVVVVEATEVNVNSGLITPPSPPTRSRRSRRSSIDSKWPIPQIKRHLGLTTGQLFPTTQ